MKKKIEIKYHDSQLSRIEKISVGDWIDLRTAENVELHRNEFKLISLGVSIKLPKGYEAIIVPRSSTFYRYGIIMTNSMGIIDESYSGNNDIWKFPAFCLSDSTYIPKDIRICQFRIIKHQPKIEFKEVSQLNSFNRGGFGSTGIN
ncbi:MAG: dUTP diphosphatase [Clostridia bacterium]